MKAMTKHRSHSAAFKRQVAQEFIAGETLHGLSKRHEGEARQHDGLMVAKPGLVHFKNKATGLGVLLNAAHVLNPFRVSKRRELPGRWR